MHGRKKVTRTLDEEALKKKEQQAKIQQYQKAMTTIFGKRRSGEKDQEMLNVTGQVLMLNPDILTLWNIRKEVLIVKIEDEYDKFITDVLPKELYFTEICLKSNPKSYGAWHHRHWLMKVTNFCQVENEIKLVSKYLDYDDRNFHCWDYRRFLLDNSKVLTFKQELDFTAEKISSNFSNFSSWHLRSKLLPRISSDYLPKELDLVKNAVFTDPKDQSAWLYHLWLLKSQLQDVELRLQQVYVSDRKLIVVFNSGVPPPHNILETNIPHHLNPWSNPWNAYKSKLWIKKLSNELVTISGQLVENFCEKQILEVCHGVQHTRFDKYFDKETQPKPKELITLLSNELSWILELHDMEPDVKWPMHAAMEILRMIDFRSNREQIEKFLNKLMSVDTKRIHYYNDLYSKFKMEWMLADILEKFDNLTEFSAEGMKLTALYYPEKLSAIKRVNLSDNKLKNHTPLAALVNCKYLDLRNNIFPDTKELRNSISNMNVDELLV